MLDQGSLASRGEAGSIGAAQRHLLVSGFGAVMIPRLEETPWGHDDDMQTVKQAVGTFVGTDIVACLT
jgi:hypothetical protein